MRDATLRDSDAIFRINAEYLPGVSQLTPQYFEHLIRECVLFQLIEVGNQVVGYLCAMNANAIYDGEEFQWFREHFDRDFLYVDQAAIGRSHRGPAAWAGLCTMTWRSTRVELA
jgi:predicted GNAT superfamily acetyltransferase